MTYTQKRGGGGGFKGGKKFGGGSAPWKRGSDDRGFSRPMMHKATCSDCGKSCEVPFRPTGRKPVFCSDCFGKEEGGGYKTGAALRVSTKRFDSPRPERQAFEDRSYADQFKAINSKLDTIILALDAMNLLDKE